MTIKISKEDFEALHKKIADFMKKTEAYFRDRKDVTGFYDYHEHFHLYEASAEIMLPIPKESWPKKFKDLHYEEEMTWPEMTVYSYLTDVICGLFSEYQLHFGYAFVDGKPIKTAFYKQFFPIGADLTHSGVIDPLAVVAGIEPECYIGMSVPMQDLKEFRIQKKHPLEIYNQRISDEEYALRISLLEKEPPGGWLAKENIPEHFKWMR